MRITIDIDTDHPEALDTLRADLEGMLDHTDEHGPAATWVQIRETEYEGANVRREWIGEGRDDEDESEEETVSGNCTHCGALLHYDKSVGGPIDDQNDQFCPDGERHELPQR